MNRILFIALRVAGLMLVLAGLVEGRAPQANALQEFPQRNAWARVQPSVVWCGDPEDQVKLEVHIVGRSDVQRVWLTDLGTQEAEGRAELFDDGTHDDARAGDGVFTRAGVVLPCNSDRMPARGWSRWLGFLRVALENGSELGNDYGLMAAFVHPRFKDTVEVARLGPGLTASAYALFIEDGAHEVLDGYPLASVTCGKGNYEAYDKLYSVLPDVFDIALVMPGLQLFRPNDLAENVPYNVLASNAVRHIGLPLMDNTALFGSAGRLKSTVYHSFGTLAIVDHEIAHTWGAAIGASLGLLEEGRATQGHWHHLSDIQGQLSYYYFDDDGHVGHFAYGGDNTWRLVSNLEIEPYAPLELYLMGLLPPEEVPPIHLLNNPDTRDPERVMASGVRTITIQDIMRAEGGARLPAAADGQKEFTLAFIVVQDMAYDEAAYAYFTLLAHSLMSQQPPEPFSSTAPFYWATGGRGTLSTRLPVEVPEPSWAGVS